MSMSPAIAFDTHYFVKQMVAAGFTEEQAETQVRMLTEILGYQLSTKADVANLDTKVLEIKRDIKELDAKIETIKADLQRDIEAAKADTIKWTAGMFAAQTALIIGAMFAVMRTNQPSPLPQVPVAQEMRLPAPAQPVSPPGQGLPAPSR
ncbi:MAG: hypothetical protein HQM03_08190 [Magnetococcales bacterium]|nr:hypothetical protein [Magnetococcales bacterium]